MELKLNDFLGWKIDDPDVRELDLARLELENMYVLFEYELTDKVPSSVTAAKVLEKSACLDDLLKGLKKKKKEISQFDRLVYDDVASTNRAVKAFMRFIWTRPPNKKDRHKHWNVSRNFLTEIYGSGSFQYLCDRARQFNDKIQAEHMELLHTSMGNAHEAGVASTRDLFRDRIPGIVDMLKDILDEHDLVPGAYDIIPFMPANKVGFQQGVFRTSIDIAPYDAGYSYWNAGVYHIGLDPGDGASDLRRLRYYLADDGDFRIYDGPWRTAILHEYAGHALNHWYSEYYMPKGLQVGDNLNELTNGCMSEGIALQMEKLLVPWIEKNKKRLGISETETRMIGLERQLYLQDSIYQSLYHVLSVKERIEKSAPSAEDAMIEITGKPIFFIDNGLLSSNSLVNDLVPDLNYIMGNKYIEKIMRRFRKEYGRGSIANNTELIIKGLLCGAWRYDTKERFFFDEYIPRVKNFLK